MPGDNIEMERRGVLKKLGMGLGGIAGVRGISNYARAKSTNLNGVAYDPVTHEILGDASAKISRNPRKINGRMKFLGDTYPLRQLEADQIRGVESQSGSEKHSKFSKSLSDDPLHQLSIQSVTSGGVTGYVRPRNSVDKVAFALVDSDQGGSVDRLLNLLDRTGAEDRTESLNLSNYRGDGR